MKKFKDLSINIKVPVMVGGASLVVLSLICLLLILPLRSNSLRNSAEIAQLNAAETGDLLSGRINSATSVIRAYSGVIAQVASSTIVPREKKREHLLAGMEMLIKSEKKLNNIWCTLEPNALDGLDSLFINRAGSNSKGVFAPWFADGKSTTSENDYEADYYAKPKETLQEYLTEPYWDEVNGQKIHMFSICIPIISQGKFIGVIGADFYAADLDKLISSNNKNSVGKLVTNNGNIAVHRDPERIGKQAEHGNREILDKLPAGKTFEGMYRFEGRDVYKVYVPIRLGETSAPWFYAVDVPKEDIYAQAQQTAGYLIAYCMAGIVLIALAGWLLVRSILKGVINVTDIIHQLSFGRINMRIGSNQNLDEIGKMKTELGNMVGGLQRTANFAHNIGEGDLNADYHPLSKDDILGNSLLEMRQSLQKAANEETDRKNDEEQRNWGTTGLARFADILRQNNSDLDALSYNIIINMVKYLNANQGGIFVLNDEGDEKALELKACYAYERKKFLEKRILPGEGLVGTCYLEGEPIYMTDVPDSYVSITSGLGDSSPRALLICPLKMNGGIYGVVELASFRKFEPYQIEFIQKVGESIAATLSAVKVNIRTERLLEQTKLQAEEMANQDEELRQNMEEMQATQEEMRRRETELQDALSNMEKLQTVSVEKDNEMQQFYKAIFESFNMVEFSPEAIITDINQMVIDTFDGATKTDFVGRALAEIIGEETAEEAWDHIKQGRTFENVQPVATGPGKSTIFRQKFIPICSINGVLQRALLMAYPE